MEILITIPDVIFCQQVLFIHFPFGAICRGTLSCAPVFREMKPIVPGNYRTDRLVQFLFCDMVLVDPGDLSALENPASLAAIDAGRGA